MLHIMEGAEVTAPYTSEHWETFCSCLLVLFFLFGTSVVLQVERHIYWPQHGPFELCKKHGITFTACVFLGFPARTDCVPGHKWPEGKPLKEKSVLELPKENGKTPAQVKQFSV